LVLLFMTSPLSGWSRLIALFVMTDNYQETGLARRQQTQHRGVN